MRTEKWISEIPEFPATKIPPPFLAESQGHFVSTEGATLDATLRITMELAAELWATRQRLKVLEHALEANGVLSPGAVELSHVSPSTGEARRERTRYVNNIFRYLLLEQIDDPLSAGGDDSSRTPIHGTFADKVHDG